MVLVGIVAVDGFLDMLYLTGQWVLALAQVIGTAGLTAGLTWLYHKLTRH